MTTKEKILAEALQQLNKQGIDKVSIRSIANNLNMSAGNLAYHYKNIDAIIYALYLQLIEKMSGKVEEMHSTPHTFSWFWKETELAFATFWSYRFLLLDFTVICRRIPLLHEHFLELIKLRHTQFLLAIDMLIAIDILDAQKMDGEAEDFVNRAMIFFNWWIPQAHILFPKETETNSIIQYYTKLFFSFFKPYFSEQGKKAYLQQIDSQ